MKVVFIVMAGSCLSNMVAISPGFHNYEEAERFVECQANGYKYYQIAKVHTAY